MGGCCSCCSSMPPSLGAAPETFPKDIVAYFQFYEGWAKDVAFKCDKLLVAYPKTEQDVLAIVQWAHKYEWRVRPTGQRHNWSPLTIGPNTGAPNKICILDMRQHLDQVLSYDDKAYQMTVQPGMMLGDLLNNMEKHGMGLRHTPAPYDITVGGITTINGHGTRIPNAEEFKAGKKNNFGTVSNRIIKMRVVCYEEGKDGKEGQYILKDFTAKDPEFPALQCAVGRTLAVAITFQAEKNWFTRCRTTFHRTIDELITKPAQGADGKFIVPDDSKPVGERFPAKSYAYYVDKYGASEIIWFPWTENPWLKVWTDVPEKGPGVDYSRKIDASCPYQGADHVPLVADYLVRASLGIFDNPIDYTTYSQQRDKDTATIRSSCCSTCCGCLRSCCPCCCCCPKVPDTFPSDDDRDLYGYDPKALGDVIADSLFYALGIPMLQFGSPSLSKKFGPVLQSVASLQVQQENVWDIWGASKNTMLYCRSTTALVTANGYAVWLPRRKLELACHLFIDKFKKIRDELAAQGEYPANMPIEIRVTGPDYANVVAPGNPAPYLSACTTAGIPQDILNDDPVVLWLDNLTFPGTPNASAFYARLEKELFDMYTEYGMFFRPEWSKGWGYSAESGAYTNKWFLDHTRKALGPNWNLAIDVLDKLDPKKLFSNVFWDNFMSKVGDDGAPSSPTVQAKEHQCLEEVCLINKKRIDAELAKYREHLAKHGVAIPVGLAAHQQKTPAAKDNQAPSSEPAGAQHE